MKPLTAVNWLIAYTTRATMTIHQSTTKYLDGMTFEIDIDGFQFNIDTTPEHGGDSSAPSPKKLLLGALAGCTGMDVVALLHKMRVSFSHFNIEVEADLGDEHPKQYEAFRIVYQISASEDDREKIEKAITLSQERYCGVAAMYRHFASLDWKLELKAPQVPFLT